MYIWCMFDMNENSVMVISSTKLLQTKLVESMVYACTYTHRQVQELSDQGVAMGQRQEVEHIRRTSLMEEQIMKEKMKAKQLHGNGDGQPQTVS